MRKGTPRLPECVNTNCSGNVNSVARFNFNFETVAPNCYAAAMSRKATDSHHGLNDVIGVALLAAALLLLVAQLSFDRYDLSFVSTSAPHNHPHNWIGSLGADVAYAFFFVFGLAAYVVPFLLAAFGTGCICKFLSYLRERWLWFCFWSVVLIFSLSGLLDMMDGLLKSLRDNIDVASAGGLLGKTLFDFKLFGYDWGFWVLGPVGATIIYLALCFISLLFLTNFKLGGWIRALLEKDPDEIKTEKTGDEAMLERRARELEKEAKKLQEQVARSGLGADGLPVPEPTVRDLSVPQNKSPRFRKTTLPEAKAGATAPSTDEGEAISAKEIIPAATTEEILGRKSDDEKPAETKSDEEKIDPEKPDGRKIRAGN